MFECASRDLRWGCTAVHFSWPRLQFLGHVLVRSLEGEAHYFLQGRISLHTLQKFWH